MKVTFWGVRGFVPVPGRDTSVYGGNTICLGIKGDQGTNLAIDAGTGITNMGSSLMNKEFSRGEGNFSMIITHTHYDHIQGFPFFVPAMIKGNNIKIYGSNLCEKSLENVLENHLTPIFSPMQTLRNFNANISFSRLEPGKSTKIGNFQLEVTELAHKVDWALGLKLEGIQGSLGYAANVTYQKPADFKKAIEFFTGVDVLIHDATSTRLYDQIIVGDHSQDARDAVKIAGESGVKKLYLTHFHHTYTDETLEQLLELTKKRSDEMGYKELDLSLAREGNSFIL
ncbi:MAG: MBL fold metallo-hydrolase [Deltaproteobacteria bacterium]|jgi:phosphoribosyl 1,2-cyclic phosphodiesterase|nr:MBL fold metallo-hydrolase [Deltaproteobacteria bacterium]